MVNINLSMFMYVHFNTYEAKTSLLINIIGEVRAYVKPFLTLVRSFPSSDLTKGNNYLT